MIKRDPWATQILELSETNLKLNVINIFQKTDDKLDNKKLESLNKDSNKNSKIEKY